MLVYHATDWSCAESILREGFRPRRNLEHWLGNGVYFYTDYQLAQWWTTKPSRQFGAAIRNPAILSVDISISPSRTLDLRSLADYKKCLQRFCDFSKAVYQIAKLDVSYPAADMKKRLRCSFFDWIFDSREIDCVIGCFTHEGKAYLRSFPDPVTELFQRGFDLPFAETQVCVREGVIQTGEIYVADHPGGGGYQNEQS